VGACGPGRVPGFFVTVRDPHLLLYGARAFFDAKTERIPARVEVASCRACPRWDLRKGKTTGQGSYGGGVRRREWEGGGQVVELFSPTRGKREEDRGAGFR